MAVYLIESNQNKTPVSPDQMILPGVLLINYKKIAEEVYRESRKKIDPSSTTITAINKVDAVTVAGKPFKQIPTNICEIPLSKATIPCKFNQINLEYILYDYLVSIGKEDTTTETTYDTNQISIEVSGNQHIYINFSKNRKNSLQITIN